jgi:transcriptional regulator with XRE-family HTH domain
MSGMIGEKIRHTRNAQQRSLADVAGKAKISVATLSRIENEKQSVDVELLLTLARVLKTRPTDLLVDNAAEAAHDAVDPLARRIAGLEVRERTELWRELAAERRQTRGSSRKLREQQLGHQVEELLAQLDFLREELEVVKSRIRRRR